MQNLDFSALEKAIASLKRGLARLELNREDEELRDGVIHRFKYTFELCWKMLKRQLELDMPNFAKVDTLSYRKLIREGAEREFITEPERWFTYRDQRNNSAHTYNAEKAREVYASVIVFLPDAERLLRTLSSKKI